MEWYQDDDTSNSNLSETATRKFDELAAMKLVEDRRINGKGTSGMELVASTSGQTSINRSTAGKVMVYAKQTVWNEYEDASSSGLPEGAKKKFEAPSAVKLVEVGRVEGEKSSDMELVERTINVQTSESPAVKIPRDAMMDSLPVIRRTIRPLHRQPCACKLCTLTTTKNDSVQPTGMSETLEGDRSHPGEKSNEQNARLLEVPTRFDVEAHYSGNLLRANTLESKVWEYKTKNKINLVELGQEHVEAPSTSNKQHFRENHLKEKPFACNSCEYRTANRGNLKKHQDARHHGMRPYSCDQCDYKAGHPSTLRAHVRVHTGDRPYACEECGHRSKTLSQIKRHRDIHTRKVEFYNAAGVVVNSYQAN